MAISPSPMRGEKVPERGGGIDENKRSFISQCGVKNCHRERVMDSVYRLRTMNNQRVIRTRGSAWELLLLTLLQKGLEDLSVAKQTNRRVTE